MSRAFRDKRWNMSASLTVAFAPSRPNRPVRGTVIPKLDSIPTTIGTCPRLVWTFARARPMSLPFKSSLRPLFFKTMKTWSALLIKLANPLCRQTHRVPWEGSWIGWLTLVGPVMWVLSMHNCIPIHLFCFPTNVFSRYGRRIVTCGSTPPNVYCTWMLRAFLERRSPTRVSPTIGSVALPSKRQDIWILMPRSSCTTTIPAMRGTCKRFWSNPAISLSCTSS
mmetsp:Transcript_17957/g.30571  ORF Transcript_17957/g.30571 Transcript_17957/m.30571 type:complete len:223 (-) Transcript_17957:102-770(-)